MSRDGSSGGVAYIVTIDEHSTEEKVILGNDLPTFFNQWSAQFLLSQVCHSCAGWNKSFLLNNCVFSAVNSFRLENELIMNLSKIDNFVYDIVGARVCNMATSNRMATVQM